MRLDRELWNSRKRIDLQPEDREFEAAWVVPKWSHPGCGANPVTAVSRRPVAGRRRVRWTPGCEITGFPVFSGVDTRASTKKLRTQGSMLGKIVTDGMDTKWEDPNERNIVAEVSQQRVRLFPSEGAKRIILGDFGRKLRILWSLHQRGFDVLRVPWDHDWTCEEADGVVLSNGPGDPKKYLLTLSTSFVAGWREPSQSWGKRKSNPGTLSDGSVEDGCR